MKFENKTGNLNLRWKTQVKMKLQAEKTIKVGDPI